MPPRTLYFDLTYIPDACRPVVYCDERDRVSVRVLVSVEHARTLARELLRAADADEDASVDA